MTDPRPRLAPGVRIHHDRTRGRRVLLLPERVAVPDERALAVLERIDGRSAQAIVDELAGRYGAPVETVSADVRALLSELDAIGAIDWTAR